jgi:hypothetical protein
MRFVLCVLFSALLIAPARAQQPSPTTQTGTATKGTNKVYTFVPATFGQILERQDTVRTNFYSQGAGSTGTLAHPVAQKIADRIKDAKLN